MQRVQAVQPAFELTATNEHIVAEICVRLDGLPLAIELAAARIKLFPPQALLKRLSHRLTVLTGGVQDAPVRQQTLRNTLQWSYDLLSPQEQSLFRRLSVFVGGCTLEALEAICSSLDDKGATIQVVDAVASLIDKNLLQPTEQEGEEPRFLPLETMREYGLECLATNGEIEMMNFHFQDRSSPLLIAAIACHPEPIRFAQGKLREGSVAISSEMLSEAKHDRTGPFC